ncbi:FAD-binding protein [Sulfolobus sp. E5-1-F]|uniref:FAD-binding oxidoreductase n=1 Tax=Saccharolobus sp. E5-1-F TaxID=2663019 RepID=UPI001294AF42|nr:FAD-binding oxidoreductase [Sulfolobus sp. E5-1-F]QGA55234.1 FAD-binding protein [Sulfolobus sp. E5-1-F]
MDWIDELARIVKISDGKKEGSSRWKITAIPRTYEELKDVIKFANERKLSIYPFSFNMHHIGPSINTDIGVKLSQFDKIIEISDEDLYVTSQVGVKVSDLFEMIKAKGLFLPAYYDGSLGGLLATNLPTPFSSFYGYPKNLILMAKVITGDGIIVKGGGKTLKFSSGYKIHKILSGMLGWLGIYLEATLKVYPFPEIITTFQTDKIALTSKYRPISIIYEVDEKGERTHVTFIGFRKAMSKIEEEIGVKGQDGFYDVNYINGESVVSIHTVRGREVEEIKKAKTIMKVKRGIGIIGTGYCRLEVDSFENLEVLRREINGHVVVERGDYKGDYWGISDKETLHKLKEAFDPNNILLPGLLL